MKLTKNEKATLKLLLQNARISDTEIATKLKISSQAVGKIRKKLENTVITSYAPVLDFAKLGVETIALAIGKITDEGREKGEIEVEQALKANPHVLNLYRVAKGCSTHILIYGFENLQQLENFFQSKSVNGNLHKHMEIKEVYTFSHNGVIKNNPEQLYYKLLDQFGKKNFNTHF